MCYDDFNFQFDAFVATGVEEHGTSMDGVAGLEDPLNLEDQIRDALALQEMSNYLNPSAFVTSPSYGLSLIPMEDNHPPFEASISDFGLPDSPNLSFDQPPKAEYDDSMVNFHENAFWSGSIPASTPPPLSPDLSGSSSFGAEGSPASSYSSQGPSWTYDSFREGLFWNPDLLKAFDAAAEDIARNVEPSKEQVSKFVLPGAKNKNYVCAVDNCEWHIKGWKREDRGIAHVRVEHFKVLQYVCQYCERNYKWPHDLAKHRQLKHPEPGDKPVTKYACTEPRCTQSFDKSSNLIRHRRNVHKKAGARKARREH